MEYVIHSCELQAQWHYEQYEKFTGYVKYYIALSKQNNVSNALSKQNNASTDSMIDDGILNSRTITPSNNRRRKKHKKKKKKRHAVITGDTNTSQEAWEDDEDINDEIFQLDDGFRDFLRQSAEFRKQRDAEKRKKEKEEEENHSNQDDNMECIEYVDVMRKGPEGTILPPTASNRKQLYEEKYGEKGTTILSLETALQWKYNTFTDLTSPAPWPSLQLRFT